MKNSLSVKIKNNYPKIVFIILGAILFLGGLGAEPVYIYYLACFASLLLIASYILIFEKFGLPPNFKIFILFLIIYVVSFLWSKDRLVSFEYLILFLSGTFFWVFFYNVSKSWFKEKIKEKILAHFVTTLSILGIVFGFLFIFPFFKPKPYHPDLSLYLYENVNKSLAHIGSYWSIVLVSFFYILLSRKRKFFYLFLNSGLGVIFLFLLLTSRMS